MSISRLMQMGAAGAGGQNGWIALIGGATQEQANGVAVDSLDNIIVSGFTNSDGAGSNDGLIIKQDTDGLVLWDKTIGTTAPEQFNGVAIDSADNIIATGTNSSNTNLTSKLNSSGVNQWTKRIIPGASMIGYGVAIDSFDNIYLVGFSDDSDGNGDDDLHVAKYNSSGAIQWQRLLGRAVEERGYAIAVDSADNIIVVGYTNSMGAGGDDFLIAKYNSSGTLQWQRTLGGAANDIARGVAVDSADNIIVVGYTSSDGAGGTDALVAKYNSSGTLQWQRTLGGASTDLVFGVAIDSSNNIIVVGYTDSDGAGGFDVLIAKYNSSGTLQWQRTLGGASTDLGYGVAIDSSDNIIVCGRTQSDGAGSTDALIAKLLPDGSGTGTYGSFTYQAATLTDAAAVLTAATPFPAAFSKSFSAISNDYSVTTANAVLTEELIEITP